MAQNPIKEKNLPHDNPPSFIRVRGAKVHNLKNIDVDIPLHKLVGIAGVSGSGKSSLALGVLYAEGSRRYLEALSAYTRRRMTQEKVAKIESIENIPATLALHQRPAIPGVRSTFGTSTELLNNLRLMFSRLGSHKCPNGHVLEPSFAVATGQDLVCPICGVKFTPPSAQDFSFNSDGACLKCGGTGIVQTVDESTLVPDPNLTIDEGAVAPWNSLMWSLMSDVCREMGVRTNVPFSQLTQEEKEIVYHGPAVKKHIFYKPKNSNIATDLDFTYYSAVYTVENALSKVKDEKGMKRVEKFLKQDVCPECQGIRLNERARTTLLCGMTLPQLCALTLEDLTAWVRELPSKMPKDLQEMAESICTSFLNNAKRLLELGLGYLTLDRASATLSTGERQRVQLARSLRDHTTGVLYVLDEPSIGLHPSNVDGLLGVIHDLIAHGNSVVLVDHDIRVLKEAQFLIEMGEGAGEYGGRVIAKGSVKELIENPNSLIGLFLSLKEKVALRPKVSKNELFSKGTIKLKTMPLHTVKALDFKIPKGRLIAITGVSGSGKTTLILESLVPALEAQINNTKLPSHIKDLEAEGIKRVNVIDATPIGNNIRSTVATYSGVLDDLRQIFSKTSDAKSLGLKPSDFSYNTGKLRCPTCDGTGQITIDIQFLPDVEITCPSCEGSRYAKEAFNGIW